uniref:RNA-directed DNA polymerase homolog n=1 Tax=Nicotiana tabacum TaxID=4097 RepID=A0A1S4CBR0_TOBAC|nr:PREDICTED: uncharacterized protein LOC107817266 [Nicotiana tabacum]
MGNIEEMLKKIMVDNQNRATTIQNLERQMGQLASSQNTKPAGALPSNTEANPKAPINAVLLRNVRELEYVPSKKRNQVTFSEKQATREVESETTKESEKPFEEAVAKKPQPIIAKPPPLFHQRLQKVKDNAAYKKFLDILKQVQISIPLVDILQEVPKYEKYINEIVANKCKLTKFETVTLTEESSTIPYLVSEDPLGRSLIGEDEEEDELVDEIVQVLNITCQYVNGLKRFEEIDRPLTLTPPKCFGILIGDYLIFIVICARRQAASRSEGTQGDIGWTIADIKRISPSFCMHKIFLEDGHRPNVEHQRRLNPIMKEYVPKKGAMIVVANGQNELIPTRTVTGWRVYIDYRKLNKATCMDHFPLPFIDQMLDRLAGHEYYYFLDGYSGYNRIVIAPEDQE